MRRGLRLIRILLHIVAGCVQAILLELARIFCLPVHRRLQQYLVMRWLRGLSVLLGLNVRVSGRLEAAPALIAVNHISWLDVVVLGGLAPIRFVAKQEVKNWPVAGWLAQVAGTIFIQRANAGSAVRALDLVMRQLETGSRVVLFPEGTSTDGHGVKPFRSRLLQPAVELGLSVQPVALAYGGPEAASDAVPFVGNDQFLPHLWRLLTVSRIEVQLRCCQPVSGSLYNHRRKLAAVAERRVRGALETARGVQPRYRPAGLQDDRVSDDRAIFSTTASNGQN